jgi:XTP/dITP diphosphohydrolase
LVAEVVVATRNRGKVAELARLFDGLGLTLLDLNAAGVTAELAETGTTFQANAIQKAEQARDLTGRPALADDSGLSVDALGGGPGVYSARYGGPGLSDRQRLELLLAELNGVPPERRSARFICVLALARPGRPTLTVEGRVEGRIATAPAGSGGFGYDPIFLLPELGRTTAELTPEAKDALSHRGRAAARMRAVLAELIQTEDL